MTLRKKKKYFFINSKIMGSFGTSRKEIMAFLKIDEIMAFLKIVVHVI